MHQSHRSERQSLKAASGHEAKANVPDEQVSIADIQTPLYVEQCINRLGQQLNQAVTAYLKAAIAPQMNDAIEPPIFQLFAQELSAALGHGTVLILRENRLPSIPAEGGDGEPESAIAAHLVSTSDLDKCSSTKLEFTIQHIASQDASSGKAIWNLLSGRSLRFAIGETLSWEELQHLQAQTTWSICPIKDDQSTWGWLLVDSAAAGEEAAGETRWHLIEQSICQCVAALQQISLIQIHQQQRQKLLEQNQELVQANQLKSEFLANTSHEIRTPLSSILGFTHLLQVQGFSPTNLRHQEYLNIILSSGQHLLALINDILDLSKIEANQLDLEWETVDVRGLCQMAITLVKEKAGDKGLMVHLKIAPQITTMVVDGLRLKQMLFNLLSNAIKFTLKGSVGLEVTSAGDFLRFSVWDTGTGISEEQQRLLFRPYTQLANMATQRGEGTGLGLALTQKLAELHGGWIEVHSEMGLGSQFAIALPLMPPAISPETAADKQPVNTDSSAVPNTIETGTGDLASDDASTGANSPRDLRPTNRSRRKASRTTMAKSGATAAINLPAQIQPRPNHLMLVEDNVHNAKLMLTFLSKTGYEVTWVQDGREMWQSLERSLPAIILMDIHLPEVDGLTLTQQLKQDDRYQSIPVIAQTALAMKGDRELCLQAGAVDYISKPIDLDVLAQMVKQYIRNNDAE